MTSRILSLLALVLVACGGSTSTPPEGDDARPVPSSSSSSPPSGGGTTCRDGEERSPGGSSDGCFSASNHVCGDFSRPFVCQSGVFRCPQNTVQAKECWCFGMGRPAGVCSCTQQGWACVEPDAGDGG